MPMQKIKEMEATRSYDPRVFVGRELEIAIAENAVSREDGQVIVFEGDRGVGKTALLLNLFERLDQQSGVKPFILSLSASRIDGFSYPDNSWVKDAKFGSDNMGDLLSQVADYFGIAGVKGGDLDTQKEYLARGLSFLPKTDKPILLIDGIYECDNALRVQIERCLLLPFISAERGLIVLSGRGVTPEWSHPKLRFPRVQEVRRFDQAEVRTQLVKLDGFRVDDYEEIAVRSGGNPLVVRLVGEMDQDIGMGLDRAIDILIGETLPDSLSVEERQQIRLQIEKLSLISVPFRRLEVENYLFDESDSRRLAKTSMLLETLIKSHIMVYKNGGYKLDRSIADSVKNYLHLPAQDEKLKGYKALLRQNYINLSHKYSNAASRYHDMAKDAD